MKCGPETGSCRPVAAFQRASSPPTRLPRWAETVMAVRPSGLKRISATSPACSNRLRRSACRRRRPTIVAARANFWAIQDSAPRRAPRPPASWSGSTGRVRQLWFAGRRIVQPQAALLHADQGPRPIRASWPPRPSTAAGGTADGPVERPRGGQPRRGCRLRWSGHRVADWPPRGQTCHGEAQGTPDGLAGGHVLRSCHFALAPPVRVVKAAAWRAGHRQETELARELVDHPRRWRAAGRPHLEGGRRPERPAMLHQRRTE